LQFTHQTTLPQARQTLEATAGNEAITQASRAASRAPRQRPRCEARNFRAGRL